MTHISTPTRKYQFERKLTYARRTYNYKKKYYGKEKPEEYDMLRAHYRRAISAAIQQIPDHKVEVHKDKYFVITYNTKRRVFDILSIRSAKVHTNKNHRGRLQEVASKKEYLSNRLKFWDTQRLEALGNDLSQFAYKIEKLTLAYERNELDTIEDVLAKLLVNIAFKPVGTVVNAAGRKDKSLEVNNADVAHHSWLDPIGGVSLDMYAESLLRNGQYNGLSEVGYAINDSEYGYGGSVDQQYGLSDDIRSFIMNYTSSSDYFAQKKYKMRELERELYTANDEILKRYGIYTDKRNVWLLLVTIDEILSDRDPYRKERFHNAGISDQYIDEQPQKQSPYHNGTQYDSLPDEELPF